MSLLTRAAHAAGIRQHPSSLYRKLCPMILLGCLILSIFVMKDVNHLKRAPLPATFHSSSLPLHGKMINKSQTEKINTLEKNARVMQATIADLKREVADLDGP